MTGADVFQLTVASGIHSGIRRAQAVAIDVRVHSNGKQFVIAASDPCERRAGAVDVQQFVAKMA